MLTNWFYHERIRKSVAVFGSLFNNIYVVRHNSAGEIINQTKVPLSYAPRRDFIDRIAGMEVGEEQERQIAIKLPRMSFEILAIQYDAQRQLSKVGKRTIPDTTDSGRARRMYNPVPYNLQFQLNVYARSQDDALQVVEQIIPFFTPQYTVSVKPLEGYDVTEDTPIRLDGVVMQDDYEGAIETRRTIIYTLDFEMKINLYKVVESASAIIRTVETNFLDFDTGGLLAFCKVESNILSGDSASLPGNILEDSGQTATNTLSLVNTLNDIQGYEITTSPEFGTAVVDSDGTWIYTPNPDAYGPDSFVIGVDVGQNVVEQINITVNGPSNAGVDDAIDDTFLLDYSGTETLTMNVSSNDLFETTGDITHVVEDQPPAGEGTVTIIDSLAGTFLYTPPAAPFSGTVVWRYRAIPDGAENSAEVGEVTITVTDTAFSGSYTYDPEFGWCAAILNADTSYESAVRTKQDFGIPADGLTMILDSIMSDADWAQVMNDATYITFDIVDPSGSPQNTLPSQRETNGVVFTKAAITTEPNISGTNIVNADDLGRETIKSGIRTFWHDEDVGDDFNTNDQSGFVFRSNELRLYGNSSLGSNEVQQRGNTGQQTGTSTGDYVNWGTNQYLLVWVTNSSTAPVLKAAP